MIDIKKIDKKRIKKVIIFLCLLLIICLACIAYIYFTDEELVAKRKLDYINGEEFNSELYPEGMPLFFRTTTGSLTAQIMGKAIYYITTDLIPNKYYPMCKQMDEDALKIYYGENQELITIELGINHQEEFISFMTELKKLEKENIVFEEYYIDQETIKSKNGKTSANLCIKYNDCEEIVFLITTLTTTSEKSSPIKITK